jgi:acyl dehydratase
LLYRLCADRHPIHADPAAAAHVGFPRPILHGLGTYGIVGHALLRTCCDYNPERLKFVYENGLIAVPTMAVVLSYPGLWISDPLTGIDWLKTVHGEQSVRFHRPLPSSGAVTGLTSVSAVTDKGEGKGAIFVQRRTLCRHAKALHH